MLHQSVCCTADIFNFQQVSDGVQVGANNDRIFINAGVKINGAYYCDMLLLPAMREICAVFFTLQQRNAPAAAHRE